MEAWLLDNIPILPVMRVLAVVVTFPALAGPATPKLVRLYVGLSLCLVLVPLPFDPDAPHGPRLSPVATLLALPMELLIGFAIGFAFSLVFHMLAVAGDFAGQEMGLNAAAQIDPQTGRPVPLIARLFEMLGLVMFAELGGTAWLLHTVRASLEAVPSGSWIPVLPVSATLAERSIAAISVGVTVALPAGLVLLLLTVFTTVAARTLPKLHIFDFAFAARMMAAVFLVSLLLPRLAPAIGSFGISVTDAIGAALSPP